MINYDVKRIHIEQTILSSFLNQDKTNEMDQMEFRDMKLPFELFKSSITSKLIAKAIYNLQEDNKPIDDLLVLSYITKHTSINSSEYLQFSCATWVTFDTMNLYLNQLREIDKEEELQNILKGIL